MQFVLPFISWVKYESKCQGYNYGYYQDAIELKWVMLAIIQMLSSKFHN